MSDYPIPKGWRRVTRGKTRKGDKCWGYSSDLKRRFVPCVILDVEVQYFTCIIRRKTAKEPR